MQFVYLILNYNEPLRAKRHFALNVAVIKRMREKG